MAIVPCPACGASVLSVASRCPTCKRYIDLPRAPQGRTAAPEWARAKTVAPVAVVALLLAGLAFEGRDDAPTTEPAPVTPLASGPATPAQPTPVHPAPVPAAVVPAAVVPAAMPASARPEATRSAPTSRRARAGAPLQTVEWVNLRTDPSRGAAVVLVIPPDAAVLADSATVGWRRVRYGDAVGWVDYRLLASGGD